MLKTTTHFRANDTRIEAAVVRGTGINFRFCCLLSSSPYGMPVCRRLMPGGACYFQMREDDVERVISHPLSMIGSDGLPHDKRPHPRLWGTFPRVLASYWREKDVLQLEQAIHKMTGLSARRFKLEQRDRLQAGYMADVVVFDPKLVQDMATFEKPMQYSAGIEQVWVNGVLSYTAGQRCTGVRAGHFLRRGGNPVAQSA